MNQNAFEILGDYAGFYAMQTVRLEKLGMDIAGLEVSHLAFRTASLAEYLVVRQKLETICAANIENVRNGRPISKLLLREPLQLSPNATTALIELIPPAQQSLSKTGLEHIGIVIGEEFSEFGRRYAPLFSGQQHQGEFCQPYFITFPDHTNVKFYRYPLQTVCEMEGRHFDGFIHALE
jgi:predicted metalloenzyme YecM